MQINGLDEKDNQIIHLLRHNARMSYSELGGQAICAVIIRTAAGAAPDLTPATVYYKPSMGIGSTQ